MYYVAYEILQNPQKAEDAVHDSFVKIIGKKNKLNELLCPQIKSLCVIVCRNTALNMLRDERKFFDVTEEFIEEIPHSQNLEDILENQIEEDAIVKKILSLPTTYRDVLYLYYEFEYKVKEIAIMLNISNEAAKKRLQRAKKELLKILEEER